MSRRRHPPSPLAVLDRLERELRRKLTDATGAELPLSLRFAVIHDADGAPRATVTTRPQPAALELVTDAHRQTLADALREAATILDPRPQE
jgi:hypothetical protein